MCCAGLFRRRWILVPGTLILVVGMAVLWDSVIRPGQSSRLTVWTSRENDVDVRIDLLKHRSGEFHLSGTFAPTRPQFRLYSKELPEEGLNGLGRPTLLQVIESDSLKVTGPLTADKPVQDIYMEALNISFPVYPIGPVTLSLPFEFSGNGNPVPMEISITYMACSDQTCLLPVIDKHILIQVPASFFDQD